MSWIKHYHDDHMNVLQLLAKLEGNLKAMETGTAGPAVNLELQEFGEVLENVIIPHFKSEEKHIYVETSKISERHREFIYHMLDDHRKLYVAFEEFIQALKPIQQDKLTGAGETIIKVLRSHIIEEEKVLPELAKEEAE